MKLILLAINKCKDCPYQHNLQHIKFLPCCKAMDYTILRNIESIPPFCPLQEITLQTQSDDPEPYYNIFENGIIDTDKAKVEKKPM